MDGKPRLVEDMHVAGSLSRELSLPPHVGTQIIGCDSEEDCEGAVACNGIVLTALSDSLSLERYICTDSD